MTTRYQRLANDLATRIRDGVFQPGTQLPSVRELCHLNEASPATVTHALHLLEDAGLIEARPRMGFFVRVASRPFPAPEQTVSTGLPQAIELDEHRQLMLELLRGGTQSPLGRALIDPAFYPLEAMQRHMSRLARHEPDLLAFSGMDAGNQALREQLARRSIRIGCDFRPEEIVITHGDKEAVAICLRMLTQPGDTVAVGSPGDPSFMEILKSLKVRVLEIPVHPVTGISLSALREALDTQTIHACLFCANFPIPTCSMMSDEHKAELVSLLAGKGIPLIEEDSFGELHNGERRPLPLKAFDQTGNVLYCADLSFSIAPGLPCGFAATGRWRLQFEGERNSGYEPVSSLIQSAYAGWLNGGQHEPGLRRLRQLLAHNVATYRRCIGEHFPAGTRIADVTGGSLIWVELPHDIDTVELLKAAIQRGVRFAPGRLFSLGNACGNCLRINAGMKFNAAIAQEIATIGELICRQALHN
ncbi:PLP-dependent aminotransferase family protein [Burkholderiaceae bacterium DAT-1]|nr:PLP-dependent aminotransferase family protein [Burkholderiaceae bacterium DAT-1]